LENAEDIKNACIVSQLEALKQEGEIKIEVLKAEGLKCPRCWQWSKEIGKNRQYPELCPKCSDAMEKNFKDA
jgi:isoleucyl-tRNA synthetase